MKSIFLGGSSYLLPTVELLARRKELSSIITTSISDPIFIFGKKQNIPSFSVKEMNDDVTSMINNEKAEIGILANFRFVIPESVLKIFPKGILNIHPSLLPKYRGPTPGQTAILNGDQTTGVSLINLDDQLDHGPVIAQQQEQIKKNDNSETLYKRLFEIGTKLLEDNLDRYINGEILPIEQDDSKATYTKILSRLDGYIDLKKENDIQKIERMTRAFYPWPGAWTSFKNENEELRIKFLPNKEVQVEGRKPVSYRDLLNGYPNTDPDLKKLLEKLNNF